MDAFILLRNITFFFATLMLAKYFVFLILAPFYPAKETLRKIKVRKNWSSKKYQPLISVIIPARNEEVGIRKSIVSLVQGSYRPIEIIVVNDGSTDKTESKVKSYIASLKRTKRLQDGITIKYISQPNGGKGKALNHGIKYAEGEIIVTMDADSVFGTDALQNITTYFEDPSIDAVVGNVVVAFNHSLIGYLQKLEYLFGFYFKRSHAVMNAEYIFGGACASFRTTTLTKIGVFSTSNKTEDIEMSMRARFNGLNCAFAEDVKCYTEGASTFTSLINQRLRWKKGRFDTFLQYRSMFWSLNKKHNKALSWFILPYALLAELQLIFEPAAITLLLAYSFISGDYLSLSLSAMFILIIYLVNAVFSYRGFRPGLLLAFFLTWPLFYVLVWIEYIALVKGLIMVFRGHEIHWQIWDRSGVKINPSKSYA